MISVNTKTNLKKNTRKIPKPVAGAIGYCNFASPAVLCKIVEFMQDSNNWGNAANWGYRCGDTGAVRHRYLQFIHVVFVSQIFQFNL